MPEEVRFAMSSEMLIHMLPGRVAEIGKLLKLSREEQGLSQAEFAGRLSELLGRSIDLTRITKIELAGQPSVKNGQSTGYAKVLKNDEVLAIAKLIPVPPE